MTSADFVQELVEELIDAAVDYGVDPSDAAELKLALASEMLYKALEILPNVKVDY